MNNLKRVLSLALASVMLIGMMVVGASAADFTDADEIQHQEAVDVLVALGIVNGKEDGSYFAPEDNVTRGEMAKMIAVAMKGGNDVDTGTKGVPSFTDIGGHWAESYIEYCYDLGIIAGRGDGTFDPNANVTGTEVTKMVLSALGYDADAYKLKGASWATRTDELARTASPQLYEDLSGVVLNVPATRDTAAQIIWNGLQNKTKKVNPGQNTSTGEVTWNYADGTKTMLKERYDADIWYGWYYGNHDTDSATAGNEGEVIIYGGTDSAFKGVPTTTTVGGVTTTTYSPIAAAFPSTLGIENIGEKVKAIWKDKTGGIGGQPDNKDVIYGVFNTGATRVVNTTRADIKTGSDAPDDADKIKISSTEYNVAAAPTGRETASTVVVFNYQNTIKYTAHASDTDGTVVGTTTQYSSLKKAFEALGKSQSPDMVKFIFDDNNKIINAYVVTYNIGRVTGVTSSNITLSNVGSVKLDENDVYEDVAKDDVVVFTRFYNATDKDKAYFTVTKAETVEGEITAVKGTENLAIDGKTYKIKEKSDSLSIVTNEDGKAKVTSSNLGDKYRLFLAGGYVYALQSIEDNGKDYALISDIKWGTLGSDLDPCNVSVIYSDGTKETITLHKESSDIGDKDTPLTGIGTGSRQLNFGDVVKYTKSGGKLKVTQVIRPSAVLDYVAGDTTANNVINKAGVYDKDTKEVYYKNWFNDGTTTSTPDGTARAGTPSKAVAATDAVLFVVRDKLAYNTYDSKDDYYAYKLRDMGNIAITSDGASKLNEKVTVVLNKDGQVKMALADLRSKPSGSSASRVYGIVKAVVGSVKVDDDTYTEYTVDTVDGEFTVYSNNSFKKGNLVTFEPIANNVYEDSTDVQTLAAYAASNSLTDKKVAVEGYNASERLLTYYEATRADSNGVYHGYKSYTGTTLNGYESPNSITVDKDVKIFYVDRDNNKVGSEIGVNEFNTGKGYANVEFLTNKDNLVDVIMVETSGEETLEDKHFALTGSIATPDATATAATLSTAKVQVDVTADKVNYKSGDTVTYTIKVSDGAASVAAAPVTITFTNLALDAQDAIASTASTNFAVAAIAANATAITVTPSATGANGSFTVTGTVGAADVTVAISD